MNDEWLENELRRLPAPELPPAWSNWVMTFLARNPNERIASVATARQLLGVA